MVGQEVVTEEEDLRLLDLQRAQASRLGFLPAASVQQLPPQHGWH